MTVVRPRYQWLWLYSFTRPATGETWWLVLPRVSVAAMTVALAEFAQAVEAGRSKRVALVLDQAGWHTSGKVAVPEGIRLMPLPSYSPEVQPVERVWGLVDSAGANRTWEDIEALEGAVVQRCEVIRERWRDLVRGATRYHWWPSFA